MSYGGCENLDNEVADLVGATIEKAEIVDSGDEDFGTVIELHVKFRKGHTLDFEGKTAVGGIYQIWMDPEGNGPGFLSLVGGFVLEPA